MPEQLRLPLTLVNRVDDINVEVGEALAVHRVANHRLPGNPGRQARVHAHPVLEPREGHGGRPPGRAHQGEHRAPQCRVPLRAYHLQQLQLCNHSNCIHSNLIYNNCIDSIANVSIET